MVNNFKRDNIKGKKGEAIALKVLNNLTNDYTFDDVSDNPAFYHIGDIDVYDEWWDTHYFMDVKTDDCIYKTGNILCEERVYYLDGSKKGFMYSDYDYLAIVSRPNNCIYIINFEVLKKYYKQGRYMRMAYEDQSSDTYLYDCTYSEWTTVRESTCKVAGEKTRACTECGYAETAEIPLAEHTPGQAVTENNVAPRCEEKGYYDSVVYCSVCNDELSRENVTVDILGHDWDDGSVTRVATCIVEEEILYTCKRDTAHTRTETGGLDPTNHIGETHLKNEKDATCTADGYSGDTYCSDCGEFIANGSIIDKLGHNMGEWVTVKEATLLEEGEQESACSRCDYKSIQSIPRITGKKAEDEDSGVSVEYPEDSYDEDIDVNVEEVFDGSQYLTQQYGNIKAWNIKTYIDGQEVQPNIPVLVRIPLPADYNEGAIAVFHINSNTGVREKIEPVTVENGYICFIAKSFSVYIMVDESSVIHNHKDDNHDGKCDGCDYDFTVDCLCKCHKTGIIAKIIWKITIFFNKLLKRNQVCACGIYHY